MDLTIGSGARSQGKMAMAKQMNGLVVATPGQIALEPRDVPQRAPGEVLIRMRRAGICGTDFNIFAGHHPFLSYPRLVGHELSGTVAEAPEGSLFAQGQIVAVLPYIACGACHACQQGKPNCCMKIAVLGVHKDGGMCEWLAVPEANVIDVGDLTLDQAATVEFLAIGAHAVRRAGDMAGRRALVVGAGPIGLATALMAQIAGAEVTLSDLDAARLTLAATVLPSARTILVDHNFAAAMEAATAGAGFDVVFDATGNRASMERGFDLVAHGGTYVFAGLIKDDISFSDSEFHKREVTLMASRNATAADFAHVIACIRDGLVPVAALLTHRVPLSQAAEKLSWWSRNKDGLIKAIIEIS